MSLRNLSILLADDDKDDCLLFREALEELQVVAQLTEVYNGEQLIKLLTKDMVTLPDVLFLDLNMPRKNGFECLAELKHNEKLKFIPVIIFSTSFEQDIANLLYDNGAYFYIRKPAKFLQLKEVIYDALAFISVNQILQPGKENFVLTSNWI